MEICFCHSWLEVQVGAAIQEPSAFHWLYCRHSGHSPHLHGQGWVTGTSIFWLKGTGKAELLPWKTSSFKVQMTLKLHISLAFHSHIVGLNLVTWPHLATRGAGKYSRHLSTYKSYQRREMFCWTTIILCHRLPSALLIFNKKLGCFFV